jgi:hypothetical protein
MKTACDKILTTAEYVNTSECNAIGLLCLWTPPCNSMINTEMRIPLRVFQPKHNIHGKVIKVECDVATQYGYSHL